MKWFQGNIPEAIQLAKTRRSIFLVYIYGNGDETSTKVDESFDNPALDQLCLTSNTVAIKLEVKSEPGIQFSQIYPVVIVPCVFFINGDNGVPLEVAGGYLAPEELAQKFSSAVQLHQSSIAAAGSSVTPASVPSAAAAAAATDNPEATVDRAASAGASASSDAASAPPSDQASAAAGGSDLDAEARTSSSAETLEQKKEKALQLLAMKREAKAREEEEKEKLREIERRKIGQELARLKQLKEQTEKKEFENSYKKQKEEDRLAREKVRADLERDRQERAQRYHQEKVDKDVAVMKAKSDKLATQALEEAKLNAVKRESARIQFRMADGSSFTQVFPSSGTLADCRSYVLQTLRCKSATLSTIYPKRTFTEADMSRTLLELELAPSAALIVLQNRSGKTSGGDGGGTGGIMAIVWMFLAPLLALWAIVSNFLSPTPAVTHPSAPSSSSQSPAGSSQDAGGQASDSAAGARRRTTGQTGSDGLKRHQDGSNIRRFTANDDDDEQATWNGNSTQQM